jgi:NAD(P)-dependent dehydrogenase (short-subunit alcohol dehydrogenase family)
MATDRPVALVTGASSGIGTASSLALVREGYDVVTADIAEPEPREGCHFVRCDVSEEADVAGLFAEIRATFGRLDAAFNNAGVLGELGPTSDYSAGNFDRVIATNVRGTFLCLREELRIMAGQASGGAIVNCSSVAGLVGLAGAPAYVASKHAVAGLTKTAALEYARANIRVNAVCPGPVDTRMLDDLMAAMPGGRDGLLAMEPVGRLGTPDEIAAAVIWLFSSAASFVTGQAIAVDGGWTVG